MLIYSGCLLALIPLVFLLFYWPRPAKTEGNVADPWPLMIILLSAAVFLLLRELFDYGTIAKPTVWWPAARLRGTVAALVPVAGVTTFLLSKRLGWLGPLKVPFLRLRQGVLLLGLAHFYAAVAVVVSRLSYPYELEWIEATTIDAVQWLQKGNTLWVLPNKEFAPQHYGPLFYHVQALLPIPQAGSIYLNARWLSFGLTLGVIVCLYRLALAWSPRVKEAGILALSIFSIGFTLVGTWWDIPRPDMLFVFLGLLGFYYGLVFRESWWGLTTAGILFALSAYAKQPGVLFMLGAALVLLMTGATKQRVAWLMAATLLVSVVLWGAETIASHGVVWRYTTKMGASFDPFVLFDRFFSYFVARTESLWFTLLMMGLLLRGVLRQFFRRRQVLAPLVLLTVSTLMTMSMVIKSSWYNANIPVLVGLAVFVPALTSFILEVFPSEEESLRSPLVWVYLAIGLCAVTNPYNPKTLIPADSDFKAGNALVAYLKSKKGLVFVPAHTTFTWAAGKPGHIHYSPLLEWRRAGEGLPQDLAAAVRSREYSAIVLDDKDEFKIDSVHSVELGDLIRSNYVEDPSMAAWSGNDLIPVVGGKRRPKVFLIPRVS